MTISIVSSARPPRAARSCQKKPHAGGGRTPARLRLRGFQRREVGLVEIERVDAREPLGQHAAARKPQPAQKSATAPLMSLGQMVGQQSRAAIDALVREHAGRGGSGHRPASRAVVCSAATASAASAGRREPEGDAVDISAGWPSRSTSAADALAQARDAVILAAGHHDQPARRDTRQAPRRRAVSFCAAMRGRPAPAHTSKPVALGMRQRPCGPPRSSVAECGRNPCTASDRQRRSPPAGESPAPRRGRGQTLPAAGAATASVSKGWNRVFDGVAQSCGSSCSCRSNKKGADVAAAPLRYLAMPEQIRRRLRPPLLLAGDFLAGRLVDDLHRQADLAALVEAQELDPDLVAFLDDVGGLGDALAGELRDVDEAVLAGRRS